MLSKYVVIPLALALGVSSIGAYIQTKRVWSLKADNRQLVQNLADFKKGAALSEAMRRKNDAIRATVAVDKEVLKDVQSMDDRLPDELIRFHQRMRKAP
jgi:flagellar biosynthesis regulator FlaF